MRRWHRVVILGLIVASAALMVGPKGTTNLAHAAPVQYGRYAVTASWYGPRFHGKPTANCSTFNKNGYTIAIPPRKVAQLPFGTRVMLQNPMNGRSVPATITDTGSFEEKYNRDIDVSERIAHDLGFHTEGTATLHVTVLSLPTKHVYGTACLKK